MHKLTTAAATLICLLGLAGCATADPGKTERLAREAPVPTETTTTTAVAVAPVEVVPVTVPAERPVTTTTTPVPVRRSGVTKAQYDQLETGMSYAQAAGILGSGGQELSSSEIGAGTEYHTVSVMYQWEGAADYSNMNAMFQDDKLVTKAQFGLE